MVLERDGELALLTSPKANPSGETLKSLRALACTARRTFSKVGRSNCTKMVTLLTPMKRDVSMRATMAVSSPGLRRVFRAEALVHPQETRTLEMLTGCLVLLTTRKACVCTGPRATEPKSLDISSNIESAQVAATAGAEATNPASKTKQYRDMAALTCCSTRDSRWRPAPETGERTRLGHY